MDEVINRVLKEQEYSTKSSVQNANELLQVIEIFKAEEKRKRQARWNMNYQKSDKYKEYKRNYMREYKLKKEQNKN